MIDDANTTDAKLPGVPVLDYIRDDIARILHDLEHGTAPCYCDGGWKAWRPEADAIVPTIRTWLADVWEEGARDGSRGLLPAVKRAARNPYRYHPPHVCTCPFHYSAAMGGGR